MYENMKQEFISPAKLAHELLPMYIIILSIHLLVNSSFISTTQVTCATMLIVFIA